MPKGTPDEGIYQPEVNAQDVLPRKIIPHLSPVSTAQGFEALGETLNRKVQADAHTYAGNQLADLHLRMTQAMEDAKANAAPGAQGYTKTILDTFDQQSADLMKAAGANGLVRQAMAPGLATLRAQFGDQAIAYEAQEGVNYRLSSIKDNTDKLATIVGAKPDQFELTMGQLLTQINGSGLPANIRLEAAHQAQSTLAKAAIDARALSDPYHTMTALMKPDAADAAVMALKPEEREAALGHADALLHQRVADAERVQAQQEKAERENAAAALTGLIVKAQTTGITMQDVLAKAPLFRHEPSALEGALNLVGGKAVTTDPVVYADLLHRAVQGQDVYDDAVHHFGKDLDKSDFAELVKMGDKGMPSPIREGVEFINNAMKPGVADKYNPVVNLSHANAMAAMQNWGVAHPNATREEAMAQARSVVSTYALVDLSKSKAALPMEPWMIGGRSNMNVDGSAAAVLQAETSGQISHEEAKRRMGLVHDWRLAIDRANAAAAPPAAGGK